MDRGERDAAVAALADLLGEAVDHLGAVSNAQPSAPAAVVGRDGPESPPIA
jgi:hypothetical protein